jgi:hypothetical protein
MYEEDFLGFSYGFDADIRSFFDEVCQARFRAPSGQKRNASKATARFETGLFGKELVHDWRSNCLPIRAVITRIRPLPPRHRPRLLPPVTPDDLLAED